MGRVARPGGLNQNSDWLGPADTGDISGQKTLAIPGRSPLFVAVFSLPTIFLMADRPLGRTGWNVSEISFGARAIGETWGTVDSGESMGARTPR